MAIFIIIIIIEQIKKRIVIKIKNNENEIKKLEVKLIEKTKIKNTTENKISFYTLDRNSLYNLILKELKYLETFEFEYGFLSSIGVKIIIPEDPLNIEGFIKAPNNSPYKNGIFQFLIKIPYDYPNSRPELIFKTKIFHTEYLERMNRCDLSFLKKYWNPGYRLKHVLCALYEFFVYRSNYGLENEATELLRKNNIYEYNKKCEEYVKNYAFKEFNNKYNYLGEGYTKMKRELKSGYNFMNIGFEDRFDIYNFSLNDDEADKPVYYYIGHYIDPIFSDKALINDNRVFHSSISIKKLKKSKIIFLVPMVRELSDFIVKDFT